MFELAIIEKITAAQQLAATGHREQAVAIVDEIVAWYSENRPLMSRSERLEFAGGTADLYSQLGETAKEIPLWEELCRLAESDLSQLGLMASDEDILRTGFDFLRLGRAYRKQGRSFNARAAFERAESILEELKVTLDVEQLLTCETQVLVGEYKGQRLRVA